MKNPWTSLKEVILKDLWAVDLGAVGSVMNASSPVFQATVRGVMERAQTVGYSHATSMTLAVSLVAKTAVQRASERAFQDSFLVGAVIVPTGAGATHAGADTVTLAVFVLTKGKDYYLAPACAVLFAAGAVALEGFAASGRKALLRPALVVLQLLAVPLLPLLLPILPVDAKDRCVHVRHIPVITRCNWVRRP